MRIQLSVGCFQARGPETSGPIQSRHFSRSISDPFTRSDPFSHPSGSSVETVDRSAAGTLSKLLVPRPMSIPQHPENVQCQAVSIQCLWNCSSEDLRPQANLLRAHDMVESPQNPNPQPVVRSRSGKEPVEPKGPRFAQPPSCLGLFYSWPLLFFSFLFRGSSSLRSVCCGGPERSVQSELRLLVHDPIMAHDRSAQNSFS